MLAAMQTPMRLVVHGKPPRQLAMALDRPVLNGMIADDRSTTVRRLARLLMEARPRPISRCQT